MSTEQNKATYRRFIEEVLNQQQVDLAGEFIQEDAVERTPGWPSGLEGARQGIAAFLTAFPDLRLTIEEPVAEDHKLVARLTARGTDQGEFNGIPATGKTATVTGMDMWWVRDGKCAEHFQLMDNLSLLQQLGVIPQQEPAGP
jgi:steroid delta-isomerase-like uncharacterized protein